MKDLDQNLGRHNLIARRELIFRYGTGLALAALVGCDSPQAQKIRGELEDKDQRPVNISSETERTPLPSSTPLPMPRSIGTPTVDKLSSEPVDNKSDGKAPVDSKGGEANLASPAPVETPVPPRVEPTQTQVLITPEPIKPTPEPPRPTPTKTPEAQRIIESRLNGEIAESILLGINKIRREAGLVELKRNDLLVISEQKYLKLLFETNQFGHYLDGSPYDRAKREGYQGTAIGEILKLDHVSSQPGSVMPNFIANWMVSPSHRELILDPRFREIGPACFQGPDRVNKGSGIIDVLTGASLGW